MNRQVIKDNKEAFEHWLNSGSIIFAIKYKNGEHKYNALDDPTWYYTSSDLFSKVTYIINDKFIKYRKALFEGKTIEVSTCDKTTWCAKSDLSPNSIFSETNSYSVKDDTPTFKKGDWIEFPDGTITQVKKDAQISYAVLWEPQEKEWCVFYDYGDTTQYVVAQYVYSTKHPERHIPLMYGEVSHYYRYVAPLQFIETLKDKEC